MWDKAGSAPLQEQPVTLCNPISQTRKPGPHCSALLMKTPCTKTRDRKDTARLALVSLAGTGQRPELLSCGAVISSRDRRTEHVPALSFLLSFNQVLVWHHSSKVQAHAAPAATRAGGRHSSRQRTEASVTRQEFLVLPKDQEQHPRALHFSQVAERTGTVECTRFTGRPERHQTYPPQPQSHGEFKWKRQQGAPGKDWASPTAS